LLGGVQSSSRPVPHQISSRHRPNLIEENVLEKISSDLTTLVLPQTHLIRYAPKA